MSASWSSGLFPRCGRGKPDLAAADGHQWSELKKRDRTSRGRAADPVFLKDNMFGLCPCKRCTVDVKALTLTNLQPAYIVVRRAEANAMLTVYENNLLLK